MNIAIKTMLSKYNCKDSKDYINALKEIFQEISLLGLWRAKFFEKAAFYGGTSLRILYGLDRFSEDIDFSLLAQDKHFDIAQYNEAIVAELNAFGFEVDMTKKNKTKQTQIESAFIKANTINQLLAIEVPKSISDHIHHMHTITIKMEVDTDPPAHFTTESKMVFLPVPFTILTYSQPDLLAGKIHAMLCRDWKKRIKGRDWYDFIWYISHQIPVNLQHLEARLRQTKYWTKENKVSLIELKRMLLDKLQEINLDLARQDVEFFVKDKAVLSQWSVDFFKQLVEQLKSN